ncbi:MAG: DUF1552 domain-containing protein [Planctomycetota bacterium]
MNHSRRNFLRGIAGTTLALPWMESLASETNEPSKPNQRIAFYYVPIGVVRRGFFPGEANAGIPKFSSNQVEITVETGVKRGLQPLELTPTLQPLADLKDDVMLITGMDRVFQQGTDVHAQCASCYLSSAAPFTIKQSAWPLDRTLDHILGDSIGQSTPFRTLEFSCNSHKDNKESIYFDNISWYGTGHVAPSIRDPRKMYQRLFGTREADTIRNITDLVREDARDMERGLGTTDRQKFAEFFDSLRTIELQMDRLEIMRSEIARVGFEEPTASHLPRGEYIRLMGDLMVVALQTGLTNVATFMIGPERWDTPFTYESLFDKPRSHHQMSHNQKKFIDDLLRVDHFHMEQFAYIVERMKAVEESDGSTLLDNTMLTYGSGLGDGATHQYSDLPIIVAGRGGGTLRTGQHLHVAEGTPLANLWLTQANAMGVSLPRFADSTGMTEELLA